MENLGGKHVAASAGMALVSCIALAVLLLPHTSPVCALPTGLAQPNPVPFQEAYYTVSSYVELYERRAQYKLKLLRLVNKLLFELEIARKDLVASFKDLERQAAKYLKTEDWQALDLWVDKWAFRNLGYNWKEYNVATLSAMESMGYTSFHAEVLEELQALHRFYCTRRTSFKGKTKADVLLLLDRMDSALGQLIQAEVYKPQPNQDAYKPNIPMALYPKPACAESDGCSTAGSVYVHSPNDLSQYLVTWRISSFSAFRMLYVSPWFVAGGYDWQFVFVRNLSTPDGPDWWGYYLLPRKATSWPRMVKFALTSLQPSLDWYPGDPTGVVVGSTNLAAHTFLEKDNTKMLGSPYTLNVQQLINPSLGFLSHDTVRLTAQLGVEPVGVPGELGLEQLQLVEDSGATDSQPVFQVVWCLLCGGASQVLWQVTQLHLTFWLWFKPLVEYVSKDAIPQGRGLASNMIQRLSLLVRQHVPPMKDAGQRVAMLTLSCTVLLILLSLVLSGVVSLKHHQRKAEAVASIPFKTRTVPTPAPAPPPTVNSKAHRQGGNKRHAKKTKHPPQRTSHTTSVTATAGPPLSVNVPPADQPPVPPPTPPPPRDAGSPAEQLRSSQTRDKTGGAYGSTPEPLQVVQDSIEATADGVNRRQKKSRKIGGSYAAGAQPAGGDTIATTFCTQSMQATVKPLATVQKLSEQTPQLLNAKFPKATPHPHPATGRNSPLPGIPTHPLHTSPVASPVGPRRTHEQSNPPIRRHLPAMKSFPPPPAGNPPLPNMPPKTQKPAVSPTPSKAGTGRSYKAALEGCPETVHAKEQQLHETGVPEFKPFELFGTSTPTVQLPISQNDSFLFGNLWSSWTSPSPPLPHSPRPHPNGMTSLANGGSLQYQLQNSPAPRSSLPHTSIDSSPLTYHLPLPTHQFPTPMASEPHVAPSASHPNPSMWTTGSLGLGPTTAGSQSLFTSSGPWPPTGMGPGPGTRRSGGSDVDSDMLCIMCLDSPKQTTLAPCGHRALCTQCTTKLLGIRLSGRPAACPICRESVESYISRVFNV